MTSFYLCSSDGEIAVAYGGDAQSAGQQVMPGHQLVEGTDGANSTTHFFDGERLVEYPPEALARKASPPPHRARWSNVSMNWIDQRTLLDRRASKWAQIKAARDTAISAPKSTSHGVFDAALEDRSNLSHVIDLVRLASSRGLPAEGRFTLANNQRVTLTLAELETVAVEIGAQVQALYDLGDTLRQLIESASVDELDDITWPQ